MRHLIAIALVFFPIACSQRPGVEIEPLDRKVCIADFCGSRVNANGFTVPTVDLAGSPDAQCTCACYVPIANADASGYSASSPTTAIDQITAPTDPPTADFIAKQRAKWQATCPGVTFQN